MVVSPLARGGAFKLRQGDAANHINNTSIDLDLDMTSTSI